MRPVSRGARPRGCPRAHGCCLAAHALPRPAGGRVRRSMGCRRRRPRRAVLAGGDAVGGPERPVEVRRARQPPARPDRAHRPGAQGRVQQVAAAALQPAPPDPPGRGGGLGLEQLVQGAHREVVRGGHHAGGQPGVAEPLLDEGVDAGQQRALPAVGRQVVAAVQPGRQRRGEQVDQGRADPGPFGRAVVVQVGGCLAGQRGEQRRGAPVAAEPDAAEPGHLVGAQRQQRLGDHQVDGLFGRHGPAGGAREVDHREVARAQWRLAAVLLDQHPPAPRHVDPVLLRVQVRLADEAWRARSVAGAGGAVPADRHLADPDGADVADHEPLGKVGRGVGGGAEADRSEGAVHRLPPALQVGGGRPVVAGSEQDGHLLTLRPVAAPLSGRGRRRR
jgi:hypothetical protein